MVHLLSTAITDVRSFIKSVAALFLEIRTGLIASGTGSTFDTTKNNFSAGIGLFTVIPMNTEVLCIVKSTFMKLVRESVCFDFFGNGSRIFA